MLVYNKCLHQTLMADRRAICRIKSSVRKHWNDTKRGPAETLEVVVHVKLRQYWMRLCIMIRSRVIVRMLIKSLVRGLPFSLMAGSRGIWWPRRAAPPLAPPTRWCHRSCDLRTTPGCRMSCGVKNMETTSERLRFHQRRPASRRNGRPVFLGDNGGTATENEFSVLYTSCVCIMFFSL